MSLHIQKKFTIELFVRIIIWTLFVWLDHKAPFIREIQPEEIWMYKYPVRKSYISVGCLWLIAFGVPLTIFVTDYIVNKNRNELSKALLSLTLNYGLTGFLTSFFKMIVGRPRPNFFYRCFPDGQAIFPIKCNGDEKAVIDGRKSFPSGHSSFAFASMVLSTLYLLRKLKPLDQANRTDSWKLWFCLSPILLACSIAVSRTCDYHHHWQDVLAGSLLGSCIAFITYYQYFPFENTKYTDLPYVAIPNQQMEN